MADNYFGHTDTGRVRNNNEDTFIARNIGRSNTVLAAVIDGVGGYNGGEVAAAIAHDVFIEHLQTLPSEPLSTMADAFRIASRKITEKKAGDTDLDSMACVATMALADIDNNRFYYAHVGDTRLYLLRDGSLVKISKDHSFVGFLEDSGRLTEDAAMNHPKRNEINKALGFTQQIDTDESFIETGESPFLPGDLLLLCSDGLTDMVDRNGILGILNQDLTLQQKATALIAAANNNGGNDNVTVVLVENNKARQQPQATMPVSNQQKASASSTIKDAEDATIAQQFQSKKSKNMSNNRSNALTIVLGLLCLLFLGTTVWLFMKQQGGGKAALPLTDTTQKLRNDNEVKLQDAIDAFKGDTLVLVDTAFKQPVILSDTLHIDQDTLYIKAKGNFVLQPDTAYRGPGLSFGPESRVIVLENIKFNGFAVAINKQDNALSLRNVQFNNCRLPVQGSYILPSDKNISVDFPLISQHTEQTVKTKSTTKPNGSR
ncbi:PP2C family protein-serine/threonine phosphatase [Mucilaginibacter litoreus]